MGFLAEINVFHKAAMKTLPLCHTHHVINSHITTGGDEEINKKWQEDHGAAWFLTTYRVNKLTQVILIAFLV